MNEKQVLEKIKEDPVLSQIANQIGFELIRYFVIGFLTGIGVSIVFALIF
jgi:hypothetical protein